MTFQMLEKYFLSLKVLYIQLHNLSILFKAATSQQGRVTQILEIISKKITKAESHKKKEKKIKHIHIIMDRQTDKVSYKADIL